MGDTPDGQAEHRRQESNDDSRFHHGELISIRREEAVAEICVNPTFPGQAGPLSFPDVGSNEYHAHHA